MDLWWGRDYFGLFFREFVVSIACSFDILASYIWDGLFAVYGGILLGFLVPFRTVCFTCLVLPGW